MAKSSKAKSNKAKPGEGRLAALDLEQSFDSKEAYQARLRDAQLKLLGLQRAIIDKRIPVIMVMQGVDAAGKGGAIKRLVEAMDPRGYRVVPIGAPSEQELAHHYLWRFWRVLPARGELVIFDRSWYGRVLVERVESFCSKAEWTRAYDEINAFEQMLVDDGAVFCKFWLQISKKEQLERFRAREKNPFKRWKLTEDDWRNRRKWDQYMEAAEEMIARTSTDAAPWTLVEGEYKWHARVKVAETVVAAIDAAL